MLITPTIIAPYYKISPPKAAVAVIPPIRARKPNARVPAPLPEFEVFSIFNLQIIKLFSTVITF